MQNRGIKTSGAKIRENFGKSKRPREGGSCTRVAKTVHVFSLIPTLIIMSRQYEVHSAPRTGAHLHPLSFLHDSSAVPTIERFVQPI